MPLPGPLPGFDPRWALFLDFDGTLVDIASAPHLVRVPAGLPATLQRLQARLGGALAIVSGRPIAQIDHLLRPLTCAVAGLHGLERRRADGTVTRFTPSPGVATLRDGLVAFVAARPGLLLEDKALSFALHYRGAPEREAECRAYMAAAVAALPEFTLLDGKMVLEARPHGMDKGRAIAAYLDEAPFAGRPPVFAGDDTTDEDGFALVGARGGIAIKVGDGPSMAPHRIADVATFRDWLAEQTNQAGGNERFGR